MIFFGRDIVDHCRTTAPVAERESGTRRARPTISQSHHSRFPGEKEKGEEREEAGGDDQLDDKRNEQNSIKRGRPPNPVGDHTKDYDRLNEHEKKVDAVRIVPLIVVRQPSARSE
jgi:hypothetical protein